MTAQEASPTPRFGCQRELQEQTWSSSPDLNVNRFVDVEADKCRNTVEGVDSLETDRAKRDELVTLANASLIRRRSFQHFVE